MGRLGRQRGRQPALEAVAELAAGAARSIARQVVGAPGRLPFRRPARPGQLALAVRQFAVSQRGDMFVQCLWVSIAYPAMSKPYQRLLPTGMSSKGRNLSAMTSRARKMRLRTVPMGQAMMSEISS
jgi:hypothetical protein